MRARTDVGSGLTLGLELLSYGWLDTRPAFATLTLAMTSTVDQD